MRLPQLIFRTAARSVLLTAALTVAIAALHFSSPSEGEALSQATEGRLASTAPVRSYAYSTRPVNAKPDPKNCYLPAAGYLLIESQHATEAGAHQRAQQLQNLGLGRCTIIWLPCAGQEAEVYGLQLGPTLSSLQVARQQLRVHRSRLAESQAGEGALMVLPL